MATYSVRCDTCNAEHYRKRPHELDRVVKDCIECGYEFCPDCKAEHDKECAELLTPPQNQQMGRRIYDR
jgi:hypothetical protein